MKKLMVAAAIVCAAAMAQAGAFTWKTARGSAVAGPDGKTLVGGTAYIFESSLAETVLSTWDAGGDWVALSVDKVNSANAIGTGGTTSAASASFEKAGTTGVANEMSMIFALEQTIGDQKYLFISDTQSGTGKTSGATAISFKPGDVSATSKDSKTFAGAGWYTAVPEPTSGLLLLLGVAGLALRRRRA